MHQTNPFHSPWIRNTDGDLIHLAQVQRIFTAELGPISQVLCDLAGMAHPLVLAQCRFIDEARDIQVRLESALRVRIIDMHLALYGEPGNPTQGGYGMKLIRSAEEVQIILSGKRRTAKASRPSHQARPRRRSSVCPLCRNTREIQGNVLNETGTHEYFPCPRCAREQANA